MYSIIINVDLIIILWQTCRYYCTLSSWEHCPSILVSKKLLIPPPEMSSPFDSLLQTFSFLLAHCFNFKNPWQFTQCERFKFTVFIQFCLISWIDWFHDSMVWWISFVFITRLWHKFFHHFQFPFFNWWKEQFRKRLSESEFCDNCTVHEKLWIMTESHGKASKDIWSAINSEKFLILKG